MKCTFALHRPITFPFKVSGWMDSWCWLGREGDKVSTADEQNNQHGQKIQNSGLNFLIVTFCFWIVTVSQKFLNCHKKFRTDSSPCKGLSWREAEKLVVTYVGRRLQQVSWEWVSTQLESQTAATCCWEHSSCLESLYMESKRWLCGSWSVGWGGWMQWLMTLETRN